VIFNNGSKSIKTHGGWASPQTALGELTVLPKLAS